MAEDLGDLIDAAYAAAITPADWGEWTMRAGRWTGAHTTGLTVVDRTARTIAWTRIDHPDPSRLEEYFTLGLDRIDPQVAPVLATRGARLFRNTDSVDYSVSGVRDYYAFMQDRAGIGRCATIATSLGDGRYVGALSIHRAHGGGDVEGEQWERLAALAPSLDRALRLGVLHAAKLEDRYWDGRLAASAEPAALLDAGGRMIRATAAMEQVLRAGDGLRTIRDSLNACDAADDGRLAAVIARACPGGTGGIAGATTVSRPSGRAPYVLSVWPVPPSRRDFVPDRAAVLVTLVDRAAARPPQTALWRAAFGFTLREAQLAALLAAGHSTESAAAGLAITVATARVHLRRLFEKSGTVRQADLLLLLARIG